MKPIKEQEETRRGYHEDAARNTVHRSSLLAPKLDGSDVEISFANHFLLKRGLSDIACRLTAIAPDGSRIESRTYSVREPRVYAFSLADLTADSVANYMVEFFTAENLIFPFPAVVVNHRNEHFLNSVHSYNRVLNDVFEDDEVNVTSVPETSIDVRVNSETDTFGVFTAGPTRVMEPIHVTLRWPDGTLQAEVAPPQSRLGNSVISINDLFGERARRDGAILSFKQPVQAMFYGRMLGGVRSLTDGAFAANHSFYDCSDVAEYWPDARPSSRVYPLFDGFNARIRLYPIFSPCRLNASIELRDENGQPIRQLEVEPLASPSATLLDIPVNELLASYDIADARSFEFSVWPQKGQTPRRINHQLIYEDPAGNSPLAASVAISLRNPNALRAPRASGLCWGQCAVGTEFESRLGLVFDDPDGSEQPIDLRFLSDEGEVHRAQVALSAGGALTVDPGKLLPELADQPVRYLWYWATATRPDLAAYAVTRHRISGHCTGEHSF